MNESIANLQVQDPAIAGQLIAALGSASSALADCVPHIADPALRTQVAHAVGTVLGTDLHDLLMVLLRQHPQLDTYGLLGSASGEIH